MDIIKELLILTDTYKSQIKLKLESLNLNDCSYLILEYLLNKIEDFEYSIIKEGEEVQNKLSELNNLSLINIKNLIK